MLQATVSAGISTKTPDSTSPVPSAAMMFFNPLRKPTGLTTSSTDKPWYKKWQTWAIAGGVVVGVTGIVILAR